MQLTDPQREVVGTDGHQLITGGPGSGKTTVSILKAVKIGREALLPNQRILFLSFARATVSRVVEAIGEEREASPDDRRRIVVDTYHSFFWRILKTHGYLVGLPRRIAILTPPNEAIALAAIRGGYSKPAKLSDAQKTEKKASEDVERCRLSVEEGRVCFEMFADLVARLLQGSSKVRSLISTMYPFVILDEFQDTSRPQWQVVKELGKGSTIIALADQEQRIFEFIGADPQRLEHFKTVFGPTLHDLAGENHRSRGTDIAVFGNDILSGKFSRSAYAGVHVVRFASNTNQAMAALVGQIMQARKRLIDAGRSDWSLAILVPTKRMTRLVSDTLRSPFNGLPPIRHSAAVDMEGPILAAEVIANLLQQQKEADAFGSFVDLLCGYFQGRGGADPGKGDMNEARRFQDALRKWRQCLASGKPPPGNSVLRNTSQVHAAAMQMKLIGDPDKDWVAVRVLLENGGCTRLAALASEVRNVRLLERGTQLRQGLSQNWRDFGAYRDALSIVRQAFVHEHFATANKPETGVIVMNMHKAKGKQFDEVIIFEGWPQRENRKVVANAHRIVRWNVQAAEMTQARQNFRVSVTRARLRTTILTPGDDICVLLRGG